MNARFVVCGMISGYDGPAAPGVKNLMRIVHSTVTVRGFRVSQHLDKLPQFAEFVARLVASGELIYIEDVLEGMKPSRPPSSGCCGATTLASGSYG